MNKKLLSRLAPGLFAVVLFTACRPAATVKGNLDVIPQPQEIVLARDTTPFIIDRSTTIVYPATNEKMHRTADFLATFIKEMTGTEVRVSDKEKSSNAIILAVDSTMGHPEGYKLQITPEKVLLTGGSEAGVFYGIQTIHKALPILKDGKVAAALPAGTVTDFPRFRYRGFMIDVGRHFFPVSYLKQMIDLMALHNINYFHWHLTEDQGWRIEIKKYPKLTEIGSKRDSTIIDWETKKFDGKPHSGFYTQDEAREIVRYAADRFITVVPEIDLPGHTTAALASYPELGCTGGPYKVLCSSVSSPMYSVQVMTRHFSSPKMYWMKLWISSLPNIFISAVTNVRKAVGRSVPNVRLKLRSWVSKPCLNIRKRISCKPTSCPSWRKKSMLTDAVCWDGMRYWKEV